MTQKHNPKEKPPGRDAVERELHVIREEYAQTFGYDVHEMFEDLRKKQKQSDRAVVSFPPRRTGEGQREEAA